MLLWTLLATASADVAPPLGHDAYCLQTVQCGEEIRGRTCYDNWSQLPPCPDDEIAGWVEMCSGVDGHPLSPLHYRVYCETEPDAAGLEARREARSDELQEEMGRRMASRVSMPVVEVPVPVAPPSRRCGARTGLLLVLVPALVLGWDRRRKPVS